MGNLAITPKECVDIDLQTVEDNIPFDGHAYVDFAACTTGQIRKKAKQLKSHATNRGFTFLPNKQ